MKKSAADSNIKLVNNNTCDTMYILYNKIVAMTRVIDGKLYHEEEGYRNYDSG